MTSKRPPRVPLAALAVLILGLLACDPLKGTEARGRWKVETYARFGSQFGHGLNYYNKLFVDGRRFEPDREFKVRDLDGCLLGDGFEPIAAACCEWTEDEGHLAVYVSTQPNEKPKRFPLSGTHTRDGKSLCDTRSADADRPQWRQGKFVFGQYGSALRLAFDPMTGRAVRADFDSPDQAPPKGH